VIDLHCHVLPGLDDGPATIEDTLALARAASAGGTRTMVATPHVNWRYLNDGKTIAQRVAEVNARLATEGVALEVRAGAEIDLTRISDIAAGELARLALGDSRWLLIEPPFSAPVVGLDILFATLARQGFRVILAHPERCHAFHRDRGLLEALIDAGALASITAGSLVGRFGSEVRRFALALMRDGMVHNVASDAHDHLRRPPGIAPELEEAGYGALTGWLAFDVPAAILAGTEIPPRPALASAGVARRRLLGWRRRRNVEHETSGNHRPG
jgi:protein-tyrosine phosphatase